MELALAVLETSGAPHEVILIVGDGATAGAATAGELASLRERARRDGVQIQAVVPKGKFSPLDHELAAVTHDISHGELATARPMRIYALTRAYELTFPTRRIPRDGSTHHVELLVDGRVVHAKLVTVPLPADAPTTTREPFPIAFVIAAASVALGLLQFALLVASILLARWGRLARHTT